MELTDTARRFVLHWGEMGSAWGVNRTVAQIHALLYFHGRPLNAEELAETLSVARSNVSTSLKELQSWNLIRVTHVLGDRRDYFETTADVWELLRTIVRERKHREFDPTVRMLAELVADEGFQNRNPRRPGPRARVLAPDADAGRLVRGNDAALAVDAGEGAQARRERAALRTRGRV